LKNKYDNLCTEIRRTEEKYKNKTISNLDINNRIEITSNDFNNEIKDLKIDIEKKNEEIRSLDVNIKELTNNYTNTTQEKTTVMILKI
jgi:archaellum component FlaC